VLAGCATSPPVISKENIQDGITFTVSMPERNRVDDPIPLHLKIENGSSQDIAVDSWPRSISVILGAGTTTPQFTGPHPDVLSKSDPPRPRQMLHPGHSYETDLNLEQYLHLDSGDYPITVSTVVWTNHYPMQLVELRAGPFPVTIEKAN